MAKLCSTCIVSQRIDGLIILIIVSEWNHIHVLLFIDLCNNATLHTGKPTLFLILWESYFPIPIRLFAWNCSWWWEWACPWRWSLVPVLMTEGLIIFIWNFMDSLFLLSHSLLFNFIFEKYFLENCFHFCILFL